MKTGFNRSGQMTYASRQEELEAHAEKIDDYLKTPQRPGMHLTPGGALRNNGTQYAHAALTQKRVDIAQELESIRTQVNNKESAKGVEATDKGKKIRSISR